MIDKVGAALVKVLDHLKMIGIYFFSVSALSTALWSMIAVDVTDIDAKVTAIAAGDKIFVEMLVYKVPMIGATIYYRIDNEEATHHHYSSLPDGKHVQVLTIPLEHKSEVRVDVEIVLEGLRTIFTDDDVKFTQYVVVGG